MKNFYLRMACMLTGTFLFSGVHAQHLHNYECGTTVESQLTLKDRVAKNRRNATELNSALTAYLNNRNSSDSIAYVPVHVHVAGEADGTGYVEVERVIGSMCRLNADYVDQNIQFYLSGLDFIPNPILYNHGSSSGDPTALYIMSLHKVDNALNIFIGRNVTAGDEFLAYYTSFLDVVFSFKSGIGAGDPTLTHELGHFFSLPHTFFGWEGTSYANEAINGKAPEQVGFSDVEKVVRGAAGENCQIAADGFCDTPPDYSSDRAPCPQTALMYDPDSVLIDPEEGNFMSYFFDPCMATFSNDQKNAILLDFVSRGYHTLPVPDPLVAAEAPTLSWPTNGALAGNNTSVELRWNAATDATRYLVRISRVFNNVPISEEVYFTYNNFLWLSLTPNAEYQWSVQSMTKYDLCNNLVSATTNFFTADWEVGVQEALAPIESFRVFPNPLNSGQDQLTLELRVAQAQSAALTIVNSLGQEVLPAQELNLLAGKNTERIAIDGLPAGIYLVNIKTAKEQLSRRIVIAE